RDAQTFGPMRFVTSLLVVSTASSLAVLACGSSRRSSFAEEPPPSSAEDPSLPAVPGGTGGGPGFGDFGDGGAEEPADPDDRDPVDCDDAAKALSDGVGDDWPTVTGNVVPDVFDFAVVVSNIGEQPADVTVTGPNGVDRKLTVAPGSLEKIFLPWVPALK